MDCLDTVTIIDFGKGIDELNNNMKAIHISAEKDICSFCTKPSK